MDHLPHSPPSQNVARAERGQPVPRLCFHYQRTWALSAQQMPRCTHRCRSWLFLAPIYSFALISCFSASPWFLFPPHSTPQNCTFFSNTNFPFEPPTFRAVSHAGRALRHRVGVVRPKELTSVSRKVVPTVPRPSTTAWGHPYPCTPPSPFRFLSSPPPPTLSGGLTPSPLYRGGNSRAASSLSPPRIPRIHCSVRAGGAAGMASSTGLPSEDRAPICPCSCPCRPGWGPSSA